MKQKTSTPTKKTSTKRPGNPVAKELRQPNGNKYNQRIEQDKTKYYRPKDKSKTEEGLFWEFEGDDET